MDNPPVTLILVLEFAAGEEDLDDFISDMREPAAEGGNFDGRSCVGAA